MARKNNYHFNRTLDLNEVIKRFGTEELCQKHLERTLYPFGFVCEKCDANNCSRFKRKNQIIFQCSNCRSQKSLTSGTIFERTKLPLQKWILALYFISQAKNCISALELMRHINVNYNTALLMKHKIMEAMYLADKFFRLEGRIEVDDAYLGGKKKGGKSGRGSENKVPFIVAVESEEVLGKAGENRPRRAKFTILDSFSSNAVDKWARDHLSGGDRTKIISDGLGCFRVFEEHCEHERHVTSRMSLEEKDQKFKWVDTMIANVKNSFRGSFKSIGYRRHGRRYLAEMQFKFNRRYDLGELFNGLIKLCSKTSALKRLELTRLAALSGTEEVDF